MRNAFIGALLAAVHCIAASAAGASIDVPAISGTVRAPNGYALEELQLRLQWFCIEDSFSMMNPTAENRCGGAGAKSGEQTIRIHHDGGFVTAPMRASRRSLARSPKFYVTYGLFKNGSTLRGPYTDGYQKTVAASETPNAAELLRLDLSQLTIIRVQAAAFRIRILGRRRNGAMLEFDELVQAYPQFKNLRSKVLISIGDPLRSAPATLSFGIIDGQLPISSFDFAYVGSPEKIPILVLIHGETALVSQKGEPYLRKEARVQNHYLDVGSDLVARLPHALFDGIDFIVDVD
jgi:hypothetical protein